MSNQTSTNAKRAAELVIQKVRKGQKISMRKILPEVGYSRSVADKPSKVTHQKVFIETLEKAGITDDRIAMVLRDLFGAEIIQKLCLSNGCSLNDRKIKEMIESISHHKVLFINRPKNKKDQIEIIYSVPEWLIRKSAVEITCKIKGYFKPENVILNQPQYIYNEILPEQAKMIDSILENNS